jgi:hypothetical protein
MAKNGNGQPRPPRTQYHAEKRLTQAERRATVAELYHAGKTQQEIADATGWAQQTVDNDLQYLKRKWYESANAAIGDWVSRELTYAQDMRDQVHAVWAKNRTDARLQQVMVKWTERIAKLLGLDAPEKTEDWTDANWRDYAAANGLDEAAVVAEAEQILGIGNSSQDAPQPDLSTGG